MRNNRIEINPQKLCGKPVIRGTRILVYLILELLGAGYDYKKIMREYPQLTKADILAAVQFASKLAQFEEGIIPAKG